MDDFEDPHHPWTLRSPITMTTGAVATLLLAIFVFGHWGSLFMEWFLSGKISSPGTQFDFIGMWPARILGGIVFFYGGMTKKSWRRLIEHEGVDEKGQIIPGFTGIPTLFGQPIPGILLGPGYHWLLPVFMGVAVVDTRLITTNPPKELQAVSIDHVLMDASVFLKYKVFDPYLNLMIEDPKSSIQDIAVQELRLIIENGKAMELGKGKSARDSAGRKVLDLIRDNGKDFGIEVKEVIIPKLLPPKVVTDAAAKKLVEVEEREAEKTEMDGLMLRVQELKDKGFTPEQARDFLQTERGKVTKSITTKQLKLEDSDKIAAAIVTVIESVFGKKGSL